VERIDLTREHGKHRLARWTHGWSAGPFVTVVTVGRLADGRWYAERHGRGANPRDLRDGGCVYAADDRGRRLALDTAARWMRCRPGVWQLSSTA
jgi:hypothetical protein